jgi:hypothetical protein
MSLVLDSSVTLAWVYGDETTAGVKRVFDLVGGKRRVGPGAVAVRSRQHSGDECETRAP